MQKIRILIVDDEEDILELLRYNISKEGYEVISAETGEKCLKIVSTESVDLIVLDLMMPGIDGLDVCRELKKNPGTASTPVIMLTARGTERDIVRGLESGADDYVSKPFSPKVLVARIKTILRRSRIKGGEELPEETIELCGLSVKIDRHEVFFNGTKIDLTHSEFEILLLFIKHPGRVFSRKQIMNAARGDDYLVTDRAMDVQILNLRKKLGDAGHFIKTVRGVGYKFDG